MVRWLLTGFAPQILMCRVNPPWMFEDIWWCFGVWCCLGMSWGVWGRVFVYLIGVLGCQNCYGVFGGYLRVQSMQYEALLEQTHQFGTILKTRFFSAWSFWDIKKPKPPHKSSPKMIGFGYFLYFLGLSERYYLWQLLLITLYLHVFISRSMFQRNGKHSLMQE